MEKSVEEFAGVMLHQLQAHAWKGGWDKDSALALFQRLDSKLHQLNVALEANLDNDAKGTPEAVIALCADAANYCMMIADAARR